MSWESRFDHCTVRCPGGGALAGKGLLGSRLVERASVIIHRVTAWPRSFVARSLAVPEAERTATSPSAISASFRACLAWVLGRRPPPRYHRWSHPGNGRAVSEKPPPR
jgi:hypothetical protein